MITKVTTVLLCLCASTLTAEGALIHGNVRDTSGGAISGARVGLLNRVGLIDQRTTGRDGYFEFANASEDAVRLLITAAGFATKSLAVFEQSSLTVVLDIAPMEDSIRVAGSTIDLSASEQASSVSVITGEEIRSRNEFQASELLRTLPGVAISQTGGRGGVTSAFIRGGGSNAALVTIDGMPVNSFFYGGGFDFSQVPADCLDRIELVRGAQSAIYGSYANSGVVNFVTRSNEDSGVAADLIADGGSHGERRFALSGSGMLGGFGVAGSASRIDLDSDGNVSNSSWRNENILLRLNRYWQEQSFRATGYFSANAEGSPGPYGSNPAGLYSGVDTISRDTNNTSDYSFHYQADVNARLRGEVFGGFFLNNSYFLSPYGDSFSKDLRGQGEARAVINAARNWTMSAGITWVREEVKNTYITDSNFAAYPLRRDEEGIYWENRLQFGKLFIQAGVRGEIFETPTVPANLNGFPAHDELAAHTNGRVNPKLAAGYEPGYGIRFHGSVGTGIRPPGGSDLAFTTNPNLKPERTTSADFGVAQRLAAGKLLLDGTFFYTRYADLIVSLGGSLANLSAFSTDNLANAKSQGAEFSVQFRPARWLGFTGNYTYLDARVLALNHANGVAQASYTAGQELPRRPKQSGSFRLAMSRARVSADVTGSIRGETLDVEPNYGASAGFYANPGYADLAVNLNVALRRGVTAFGTLRNALNQRYEEIYGFPSPRLSFIAGMKWSLHGRDF